MNSKNNDLNHNGISHKQNHNHNPNNSTNHCSDRSSGTGDLGFSGFRVQGCSGFGYWGCRIGISGPGTSDV